MLGDGKMISNKDTFMNAFDNNEITMYKYTIRVLFKNYFHLFVTNLLQK